MLVNGHSVAPRSYSPICEFEGTGMDLYKMLNSCCHFRVIDGKIWLVDIPDDLWTKWSTWKW